MSKRTSHHNCVAATRLIILLCLIVMTPQPAFADEWKIAHLYTTSTAERDDAVANKGFQDEGICCAVPLPPSPSTPVPLYRLLGTKRGDHFFTTSLTEVDSAVINNAYAQEGNCCFVYAGPVGGALPLYRLRQPGTGDRFYTLSASERDAAVAHSGYVSEGTCCFVPAGGSAGTAPLYRLFNAQKGLHFYTTSTAERDQAVALFGYTSEGTCCQVVAAAPDVMPLYRLYQSGVYDHFYTTSITERSGLLLHGYQSEGICCWVYSSANSGVPLFRTVNIVNSLHFYTTDASERDKSYSLLFRNEGTCCTVAPANAPGTQPLYRLVRLECRVDGDSPWEYPKDIAGSQCPGPPKIKATWSPDGGPGGSYAKVGVQQTLGWTVQRCSAGCTISLDGAGTGYAMDFKVQGRNLPTSSSYSAAPVDTTNLTLTAASPFGTDHASGQFAIDPNTAKPGPKLMAFYFALKASNPNVQQCSWVMQSADNPGDAQAFLMAVWGNTYTVSKITEDQFNNQQGCP